jgi:hypothetical protein
MPRPPIRPGIIHSDGRIVSVQDLYRSGTIPSPRLPLHCCFLRSPKNATRGGGCIAGTGHRRRRHAMPQSTTAPPCDWLSITGPRRYTNLGQAMKRKVPGVGPSQLVLRNMRLSHWADKNNEGRHLIYFPVHSIRFMATPPRVPPIAVIAYRGLGTPDRKCSIACGSEICILMLKQKKQRNVRNGAHSLFETPP